MTAALLLVLSVLPAGRAAAYERETSDADPSRSLYWEERRIVVSPAAATCGDVPEAEVLAAVARSLLTWSTAGDGCSDMVVVAGSPPMGLDTSLIGGAEVDGENRIVWRHDDWPAEADEATMAITTLVYHTGSGRIVDADIDINAAAFRWTATDPTEPVAADIENAVAHEIGHVLGFAHSTDPEATMYAESPPGDTAKRDLAPDDVAAVCETYPFGQPTATSGGTRLVGVPTCSAAPGTGSGHPGSLPLVLLAAAALRVAQRRPWRRSMRCRCSRERPEARAAADTFCRCSWRRRSR